jgi:tripartite-type tricarboxylate transporter receptor subunit TctC
MNIKPASFLSALFCGTVALCAAPQALAQAGSYPNKPLRMIVPFSPGGSADNLARTLQPGLAGVLGQQIVLDNRGGASGIIGTELAQKAPADGYTMLLITTTYTVVPSLVKKLSFDPIKDFSGVSLVVSQPNVLAVHPSVQAKSVKELVALAKGRSANLTFASGGSGSSPHLSGELFKLVAGIDLTHVPFKGSGPGVAALLGGQVTMMFAGPLAFEAHIKAGKLRALALADKKRSAILPDVPTMTEAGFAGVETGTWYGMLVPAGTPRAVIDKLHGAFLKTMAVPEMKARLLAQGVDIVGSGPREMDQTVRDEIAKWKKIVDRAGIKAD